MRVILISIEPYLNMFLRIANPKLDIASIIVPNEQAIYNSQAKVNEKTTSIYSYAYMCDCILNTYYDLIIVAFPPGDFEKYILSDLEALKINREKVFRIGGIYMDQCSGFLSLIQHVKQNPLKYKIFATGISHAKNGIDVYQFDMPTLNLAVSSQDLYYDYLFAKKLLEIENVSFKYAIIGLCPFSLHYDESHRGGGTILNNFIFYLITLHLRICIISMLMMKCLNKSSVKTFCSLKH